MKSKKSTRIKTNGIMNEIRQPIKFYETQKGRYQIKLNRLLIPDTIMFPNWLRQIYSEMELDVHTYVKKKLFRIEYENDNKVYKLCLSPVTKGTSAYGTFIVLNFNESKLYIYKYGSCGYHYKNSISVAQNDANMLLTELINILNSKNIILNTLHSDIR